MAASLSAEPIRVFRCPNCHEFINTTLKQCTFCGSAVDPAAAEAAVLVQSKVNAICNDASYARILAGTMWVFFFLTLIPFLGLLIFGAWILFFAVPFLAARSWWRIRAIKGHEDPALKNAARGLRVAMAIWGLMFGYVAIRLVGFMLS